MTRTYTALPNLPRYTSYPTAPHFTRQQAEAARASILKSVTPSEPVSVYLHIPFCDRLCWFCGCHTKHTLKYAPIAAYVNSLEAEIEAFAGSAGSRPQLGHLHFGGGSPSILRPAEAAGIRSALSRAFIWDETTEVALEVDPNDAGQEMLEAVDILGVTRASLGVQDFDPRVQAAINRPQGFEETQDLVKALRQRGVRSLNIDALYGLPFQTDSSIAKTAQQVASLEPDRLAVFGYAHMPQLKKHQQLIPAHALPGDAQRQAQAAIARDVFFANGFEPVGFDHFAKPGDSLAIAAREGTLRRNFQGYTTDTAEVLLGFGASSISSGHGAYLQNVVATNTYMSRVAAGEAAAERGIVLSMDDKIRRHIIETIMCSFKLDTAELARRFGRDAQAYIAEARNIAATDSHACCRMNGEVLEVLPEKRDLVRLVASRFDAYLGTGQGQFSKAV